MVLDSTDSPSRPADDIDITARTTEALTGILAELGIEFRYDTFLQRPEVRFLHGPDRFLHWQVFQDDPHRKLVQAQISNNFQEKRGKKDIPLWWSKDRLEASLSPIIQYNTINPPFEYVSECQRTGGHVNHENWLLRLFGLEDNVYNRSVTRLITLGLIQRAVQTHRGESFVEPGFKHYCTLVGEGDLGKTTVLMNLLPKNIRSQLYASIHVDMTANAEIVEQFSQAWLIEACELKGGSYTKNSKMKQFFDAHVYDKHRKKYAALSQNHLRTWNCVGTTNDEKFLSDDPALANRFYPIMIQNPVPYAEILEFMDAHRDNIFACAYDDYKSGGRAVVSDSAREYQRDIICDFMAQDHRLQVLVDKIIKETVDDIDKEHERHSVGQWLRRIGLSSKDERRSESGKLFSFTEIQAALIDSGCFEAAVDSPFVTKNGKYLLLLRTVNTKEEEKPSRLAAAVAAEQFLNDDIPF